MDYSQGNHLHKQQWDYIHHPQDVIGWFEDDEEGEIAWDFFGREYARLFNHVYDNNKESNLFYLEKIRDSDNLDAVKLEYSSFEKYFWNDDDEEFIDSWELGTYDGDKIAISIFDKIKKAQNNEGIESINLTANRIYIGNFSVGDKNYPVATYAPKGAVSDLKKIIVTDSEDLEDEDNINYIYCDETLSKYLIIAFYSEGAAKNDPSLIMQIEKFIGDDTKAKWLKELGILDLDDNKNTILKNEDLFCTICGRDLTITHSRLINIFPGSKLI